MINQTTVNYNNNDSEATADYQTITKTFDVSNDLIISDINLGLNLDHYYRGALDITLEHPDGTTIELAFENGESSQNLYVLFDDEASTNINDDYTDHSLPSYINLRIPKETLSAFDGKSSLGTWTLKITDTDGYEDIGRFNDSQLTIEGTSHNIKEVSQEFSSGNRVWSDINNNGQIDNNESGIDGVVVNLYQDLDHDGVTDGVIIATDTTSNGGYYDFGDLAAENYLVEIATSNFETGNILSGMQITTSNEIDNQSNATVDFGFFTDLSPTYKLSGTVLDNTHAPDLAEIDNLGDTPIENVTLELFYDDGSGNPIGYMIAEATTDINGFYEFTDLRNGNYVIVQAQPAGYESVTDIDGIDDNKILTTITDSDVINQDFLEKVGLELIDGTKYNDYIDGTDYNDYIDGKGGNDTLNGSLGADILVGGSGSDYVNYRYSDASVVVDLINNTATGGYAEGDTFDSIENLIGSRFNDIFISNEKSNRIYGGNGDDTMMGNDGNDYLSGQNDHDLIEAGAGNDRLYGGNGNDTLIGSIGNDYVCGGQGNDSLIGTSAITDGIGEVDRLKGDSGADIFVLGTENDVFYDDGDNTNNGASNFALIIDFDQTEDVIQLSSSENYYLGATHIGTISGSAVFVDNDGNNGLTSKDELVGIVSGYISTTGMIDESTPGFVIV